MVDAHNHYLLSGAMAKEALRASGVDFFLSNTTRYADWQDLKEGDSSVALGIHPWFADESTPPSWADELEDKLRTFPVNMGEIGLDKKTTHSSLEAQLPLFVTQWKLAIAYDRCPSIHCVGAWQELFAVIREHGTPAKGFYLHGFHGSIEIAHQLIEKGATLGIGYKHLSKWKERLLPQLSLHNFLPESDFSDKKEALPAAIEQLSILHSSLASHFELSMHELTETFLCTARRLFITQTS